MGKIKQIQQELDEIGVDREDQENLLHIMDIIRHMTEKDEDIYIDFKVSGNNKDVARKCSKHMRKYMRKQGYMRMKGTES